MTILARVAGSVDLKPLLCRRTRRRSTSLLPSADLAGVDAISSCAAMTWLGCTVGWALTASSIFAETFAASTIGMSGAME